MKHIKLYENFQILNEGVTYNDIMQLADRELPTKLSDGWGRVPFTKEGNPPAFSVVLKKENVKKLNSDFLDAWLLFYPKFDYQGGCQGEIRMNTFHYKKMITAQELAKIPSVYNGPVNDLIVDIKDCWIGICNGDARLVELMKRLEENGWEKQKH